MPVASEGSCFPPPFTITTPYTPEEYLSSFSITVKPFCSWYCSTLTSAAINNTDDKKVINSCFIEFLSYFVICFKNFHLRKMIFLAPEEFSPCSWKK